MSIELLTLVLSLCTPPKNPNYADYIEQKLCQKYYINCMNSKNRVSSTPSVITLQDCILEKK